MQVGSGARFLLEFLGQLYMFFLFFFCISNAVLQHVYPNNLRLAMVERSLPPAKGRCQRTL